MVRSFLPKFSSRSERRLQALCKNNPDEDPDVKKWNKNAVQYLVKKLKKNLDTIDELEKAISQECSNTKCVPLPKTSDNRLLVSHRRCLPQVIYCRLWRWPDLQSHHQIKAIPTCNSSLEQDSGLEQRPPRTQTVCVNPYHYERKKPASLEPVLVPCSRIPPDLSTSFEDSDPTGGTKAIPNRIRLPTTITGATVRSLLSASSSMVANTLHPNHPDSVVSAHTAVPTSELGGNSSGAVLVNAQDIAGELNPQTAITIAEQQQQQDNNNRNISQQVPGDDEVYMSYERELGYLPQQDPDAFEYLPTLPADTSQQQYEQQIYAEPQPQLFLSAEQQQQQTQPPPQHMHHHLHHHEQPAPIPCQPQQSQAQQQQIPIQAQQIPMQPQQQQIPLQPHQHMQTPHQPQQIQHIQQQQLRQPHQQPQHVQQQQYHQVPNPHQQPAQQGGSMLRQAKNTQTEIARPYQFKQNKFAHLARAMHEHNVVGQHPTYDPHGYVTRPYSYTQQPAPQQQTQQVQYSQQYQAPQQPPQGVTTSSYSHHTHAHAQYPQHPPPSYATIYPQQDQCSRPEQMQLDYQQTVPMLVGGTQQGTYYVEPIAGPSHSIDQSMQQPIPTIDFQEVPYSEGSSWCSISYHEYDQRVGEKYQPCSLTVSVDGYTHPMCSDRFCIGGLSNVNRNEFTEWVRRRIGKGVKLTYVDGEVHVECLCDSSIFVSSPMLGMEEGKDISQERVSKVTHGGSIRVFSNPQFSKLLSNAVSKGFEAVYKLTSYCTFRVSFVKGWGRSYKRQTILNTPCWVEVQLNGPLQWIDKVLRQMRPPQGCGSTS